MIDCLSEQRRCLRVFGAFGGGFLGWDVPTSRDPAVKLVGWSKCFLIPTELLLIGSSWYDEI